jgi:hypothetical protein
MNKSATDTQGQFLSERNWGSVPQLLAKAMKHKYFVEPPATFADIQFNIAHNLIEILKPIELDMVKSLIIHYHRLHIEQAVGIVIRLLPEFASELVPLFNLHIKPHVER